MHPRVRLNWPQAVLQVAYTGQPPAKTLDPQQANEAEELEAPLPQGENPGDTLQ